MTEKETAKILQYIVVVYPNFPTLTAETVGIWHEMLSDLDFTLTMKAIKAHVKVSRFIPTIADIREAVADSRPGDDYKNSDTYREFVALMEDKNHEHTPQPRG